MGLLGDLVRHCHRLSLEVAGAMVMMVMMFAIIYAGLVKCLTIAVEAERQKSIGAR